MSHPHGPRWARDFALCSGAFVAVSVAHAQNTAATPAHFVGDLGGAAYVTAPVVHSKSTATTALPYVYGDWGAAFARVDTVGVKALPWGLGHLEGVLRVSQEGWDADTAALRGAHHRRHPLPLGLGTFQRSAWGGVFVYALHDLNSGGNLLEATYAARFEVAGVQFYPQAGVEHRSRVYVQHLYGISADEAAASQAAGGLLTAYQATASTVPMLGLAASVPLTGPWALQLQWRHKWLDRAITHSPLVGPAGATSQNSGFAALTYSFK